MSAHTKGPWSVGTRERVILSSDGYVLLRASEGTPLTEADALLIAESPNMLRVLQLLAQLPDAAGAIAHEAAAKATGTA